MNLIGEFQFIEETSVGEFEEEFGISYKSFCFPLSPESARKIDSDENFRWDLERLWRSEPEYPAGVNELVPSSESPLDVSSLFGTGGYLVRNNGDRVDLNTDTFKGKFVLVCCFHAPIVEDQLMINLCNDLCSTRDDVVVVMAAWINNLVDADDHQEVFDHFFSGFPESCLAVPLEDSKKRAYVCKLVSDYNSETLRNSSRCLVLDTQGMVLPPSSPYSINYGAEAFPFTREIVNDVKARDLKLMEASNLEQLLRVHEFCPDVVYKFNPEGGPREEVPISGLSDKLVGLYFPCRKGDLLPRLRDIYEQCMEKQLEFEVVVVYSEGWRDYLGPKLFQEMIDSLLLQKNDICRRWWCLPLDNSVILRLNRVIQPYNSDDKLCVVGPAGGFIDVAAAGVVMKEYGIDGYPFTRDAVIHKDMLKMREITLDSVLLGDDVFRGNDPGDIISSNKLSGKKICVYFGCLYYMWDYEKVFSSYREMKAMDPGSEAVFVYLKNDLDGVEVYNKTIHAMPWYVCPVNLARLKSAREGFGIRGHAIVGFGEDGRLRSCRSAKSATFTLDDTLYEDVSERRTDLPCPQAMDYEDD